MYLLSNCGGSVLTTRIFKIYSNFFVKIPTALLLQHRRAFPKKVWIRIKNKQTKLKHSFLLYKYVYVLICKLLKMNIFFFFLIILYFLKKETLCMGVSIAREMKLKENSFLIILRKINKDVTRFV